MYVYMHDSWVKSLMCVRYIALFANVITCIVIIFLITTAR